MTADRRPPEFDRDLAEALNAALDGEPSPRSGEVAGLLATARLVRAMPLDAAEDAPPERLASLWDEILGASRPTAAPVSSQALGVVPMGVRAAGRGRSGVRMVTSWVSLAAVIAVLVGMGSMAWSLRPGGGGDHLLASATSLAVGTAYASPSPVATEDWLRWPVPEDCDVTPMSHEQYAAIMQSQPDISGRSYAVAGTPVQADAEAAAEVAHTDATCGLYGLREQARSVESPAHLFYASDTSTRTISREELDARALEGQMLISAMAPAKSPNAYAVILDSTPPASFLDQRRATGENRPLIALTFNSANALLLEDGRIAIPATALYWKDDSWKPQQWQIDESDSFSTVLYVLAGASGTWKVDETLAFCPYAGCSATWETWASQHGVPVPALDVPLPWTIPAGTATATPAAASPASDGTATPAS